MTTPDCAGCQYIETAPGRHAGRWLCRQCPELPADRRKQPTSAETVRAGLGDLLRRHYTEHMAAKDWMVKNAT